MQDQDYEKIFEEMGLGTEDDRQKYLNFDYKPSYLPQEKPEAVSTTKITDRTFMEDNYAGLARDS